MGVCMCRMSYFAKAAGNKLFAAHACMYAYMCAFVYILTYKHTYIQTYIHTYTGR